MITVLMTSPTFEGEITFIYNEKNCLSSLLISEPLKDNQYEFLKANLPWHKDQLPALASLTLHATFIHKKLEVTFDMFWNRYNDKDRSSKKKTLAMWEKMSQAEQIKAYLYIPVYNRHRGNAEKKYATTYLAAELWNN